MTFLEVLEEVGEGIYFRRCSWTSGCALYVDSKGEICGEHVTTCKLPFPSNKRDLLAKDWIIVEDYGRDIGFRLKP